ncbi:MAG: ABC transporter permease [Bacteroidetes bacterium]|nr:ABC transporter permease [Bacteroidota bacterium]
MKPVMLHHYVRLVIRNIVRNKFYSFLNIIGLTMGIVTAAFILMYILDELSYDRYNLKYKRVYRIECQLSVNGKLNNYAKIGGPYAPTLKDMSPAIEKVARFVSLHSVILRTGERMFHETGIFFTDQSVFDIFTLKRVYGNLNHALISPYTAVLTRSTSEKYFGKANPVGKYITTTNNRHYLIMAVIEDVPHNSHLKFDGLFSLNSLKRTSSQNSPDTRVGWNYWFLNYYSYILLREGASPNQLTTSTNVLYEKYMRSEGKKFDATFIPILTPLADLHLGEPFQEDQQTGSMSNLFILAGIALLILSLASINYMNLATASAVTRTHEVGIRKVLGSKRSLIVRQFMSEALIFAIISTFFTLAIIELLLPAFNVLVEKDIVFGPMQRPLLVGGILLISLVTGALSGIYPANYLSNYEPYAVVRSSFRHGKMGSNLRKGLVTIQLIISIGLIFSAITVRNQYTYLTNRYCGFNSKDIITADLRDTSFFRKYPVFRKKLLSKPEIINVSTSSSVPGNTHWLFVVKLIKNKVLQDFASRGLFINNSFLDLYQISLLQGHVPHDTITRKQSILINEAAAIKMGWQGNAIGKKILISDFGINNDTLDIVGVVRNYNFNSLHTAIEPLIIFLSNQRETMISIKCKDGMGETLIPMVKETASRLGLKTILNCKLLDNQLKNQYTFEKKVSQLIVLLAILSAIIAGIGLLGLTSFITQKQSKENGIRKVLGATSDQIVLKILRELFIPVFIAYVIAIPLAWIFTSFWLKSFAFYIVPGFTSLLITAIISFGVALLFMVFHIVKAAISEPYVSVKYE